MKVSILSVLLLCSMAAFSQRIKISETDATDHICRISTTSKWFNRDATSGFALAVRSENSSIFLQLYNAAASRTVVAKGYVLTFELDNDSSINVYSKGLQVSSVDLNMPIEYLISMTDLKMLYQHAVKSVSYYTASGQRKNIGINASNEAELQNVCGIFFKEYYKSSIDKATVRM